MLGDYGQQPIADLEQITISIRPISNKNIKAMKM